MEKTLFRIARCAVVCIGLYYAAKGMHASGLPIPEIRAQEAVQAAGMALQNEKSVSEVIAVFSDTLIDASDRAISVAGTADVVR